MKKYILLLSVCIFLTASVFYAYLPVSTAFAITGRIDSTLKYAWADRGGWINFGCSACNVQVEDGIITGYAWSDNFGWINLNPNLGGVRNDGQGRLSGNAWGENTGWIDFSNVTINSQGQFTGTAANATDSPNALGTIIFNNCGASCGLTTDWRPIIGGGGNAVSALTPNPTTPPQNFKFSINGGSPKTNNSVVNLTLDGGLDSAQIEISTDPNFFGAVPEAYETTKTFVLPSGDGQKTIYVKFISNTNQVSNTISESIILKNTPPTISANPPKTSYLPDENVVISGKSNPNNEIMFYWDSKYGIATADNNGNWTVNFGRLAIGTQSVIITAKDDVDNSTSITIAIKVLAPPLPITPVTPVQPSVGDVLNNIGEKIWSGVTNVLPKKEVPQQIIAVPKEAPEVLQHKWNLLKVTAQNPGF